MSLKKIILLASLMVAYLVPSAQTKNVEHLNQAWFGYNNQTRYSKRWGSWTDLHLRMKENFFDNVSVSIARLGLTYYLSDNAKLTLGYAYVSHYAGDNHKFITQPEHRPWQQIQWHHNFPRLRMMHWVRLEERFRRKVLNDYALADGFQFNWKLRYNFLLNVPIGQKPFAPNTFSFVVNDELHVNFGKEIVYNYFDQNRFFLGFAYHTTARDNVHVGYMNLFQQLGAGNSYKNIHALRVFYYHNLDLRKKR